MKKKIFTKIILTALLVLLLYYTAGAAYVAFKEETDILAAAGPFFVLALVVAYLLYMAFRSMGVSKEVLAKTEKLYAPYIQNAFVDNPVGRRRLLTLLAFSDKEKPAKMAAAFLALEKQAKNEWDMATILFFAARATAQAGDRLGAVRLYRRSISERDDFSSAWSNLGVLYQLDKDYGAAEECFKRALALEDEEPLRYHNLANLYMLMERPKDAAANAKQAVARNPKFRESYLVLALAAAMQGNKNEANRHARECVNLGGNESEIDRLVSALLRGEKDVLIPAEKVAAPASKKASKKDKK